AAFRLLPGGANSSRAGLSPAVDQRLFTAHVQSCTICGCSGGGSMPRGGRRIPGPGEKLGRPKKLVSTLAVNRIQPADVGQMSLAYPRIRPEYELSEGQRHALIEKQ